MGQQRGDPDPDYHRVRDNSMLRVAIFNWNTAIRLGIIES